MGTIAKPNRGHYRQLRSKRLLLLVVVLIAVAQLGVGILLDQYPLKVRFRLAESVLNHLARTSHRPDILFLGSSRFGAAVNIVELQQTMQETFGKDAPLTYNCWFPGADPYSLDFLLQHILRRGIRPGMVVLEISPETVMLAGPFQGGQVTRIMTWKDMLGALEDLVVSKKYPRLMSSRLIPISLFRMELLTYLFGVSPPYLALPRDSQQQHPLKAVENMDETPPPIAEAQVNPNQPTPASSDASPQHPANAAANPEPAGAAQVHAQNSSQAERDDVRKLILSAQPRVQRWLRNFRIRGLNARHLESMLAYFQAQGIPTILVGVPVTKMHYECYSEKTNREFLEYMDKLCRKYGSSFVDYRNRFSDELFYDHMHMTYAGGHAFSRVFQQEVLSEAWRKSFKLPQHASHPAPPSS